MCNPIAFLALHYILKNIIFSSDHFQYHNGNARQRSIIFLWTIHLNKQHETKYDRNVFFTGQSKFNKFSFILHEQNAIWHVDFSGQSTFFFGFLCYAIDHHPLIDYWVLLCDWTIVTLFGLLNCWMMCTRWFKLQKLVDEHVL